VITLDLFLKNVTDIVQASAVKQIVIHSVFGMEKELKNLDQLPPLHHVNDLIEKHKDKPCNNESHQDDTAVLQYTSGVTGLPKAAILTHRSIVSNLVQIDSWNPIKTKENRAVICIIPFFHVFGMTICMHVSILSAYQMVLFPLFDWSSIINILDAVRKYKPISFPAVPALWAALLSSTDTRRTDLSSIEVASGGGAPLPITVQQHYHELTGKHISQAYGLSEVSSTALISPFYNGRVSESVGLPLPGTDVKIVDIETGTKDCRIGEIGEIVVKGPQLMKGYWQDEARTRQTRKGDWLFTADLGYMDEEGFFFLVDRKDDLIISRGYNVYPSHVEEVLLKFPGIKEAVVVGMDDPMRGQAITAFLVAATEPKPDRKDLSRFCHQHLPEYQVPRTFKFRDQLPKNKIGKPLRRILKTEGSKAEE
jgi:long-chain acyl-CoA synthetase